MDHPAHHSLDAYCALEKQAGFVNTQTPDGQNRRQIRE